MSIKNRRLKPASDKQLRNEMVRKFTLHYCIFMLLGSIAGIVLQYFNDPFAPFNVQVQNLWNSLGAYLIAFALLLPSLIIEMSKLCGRIVGPVQKLRDAMDRIAKGTQPDEIKLRKSDFFREIADSYNRLISEPNNVVNQDQ